ncbi:HlyD family efflux transporter periplasmic adaptor subunit [Yinghuangia sp. YIM S09857]|uniref:HlyD family efflux transporter periplasmic adaptor subunit n=1 Tax=Yinghuangia sp. YIM S09857 TaxID=3436929 RepID=UPI003F53C459
MNRARRALAAVLGVVALAGAGGWYAGQQVQSPAEAAAARKPPPASLITVPVESRILTNGVVAHGTVEFESPVPVGLSGAVAAPSGAGSAESGGGVQKVTRAPAVGASVEEGSVFMEVSGRPVFVLRGVVPMYRTLGPGTKGADVRQLNEALKRIGFDPGTTADAFTSGTAAALKRWYRARGYEAKEPGTAERQQLAALEMAVQTANEALATAKAELQAAKSPGGGPSSGTPGAPEPSASGKPGGAAPAPPPDVKSLQGRVTNADKALGYARQNLADFQATYGVSLPAGELVFLSALPVRVDQVAVRPGDTPSGQVAKVTGTGVRVQTTVPGVDAQLLRPGMPVRLELDSGESLPGKVDAVGKDAEPAPEGEQGAGAPGGTGAPDDDGKGEGGSANSGGTAGTSVPSGMPSAVRIVPDDTAALMARAGQSVKVTVEVGSTGTPVLAVPVAAVFTGADGQARVKVERADGAVTPVSVTLGLAATGFVAVTASDGLPLAEGDRVVVGER